MCIPMFLTSTSGSGASLGAADADAITVALADATASASVDAVGSELAGMIALATGGAVATGAGPPDGPDASALPTGGS